MVEDMKVSQPRLLSIGLNAQFTGDPIFPAWRPAGLKDAFAKNQIHIHPRYHLMPEADGEEIAAYSVKVLKLIANGGVKRELMKKFPGIDIPDSKRCFCSAASAGVTLAVRFAW